MRAEDAFTALFEVVGVVFHEAHAAGESGRHDLRGAEERGGLPVAFRAEAVALFHEALAGEAGELVEAVEVLERGGEGGEIAVLEERAEADLLLGGGEERLLFGRALLRHGVEVEILLDEAFCFLVGHGVDELQHVRHGIAVAGVAELDLGGDLVAFGHGHFAHVVADAGDLHGLGIGPCGGDARPHADLVLDERIGVVAVDDLAVEAETGADEAELAVAVGGLVQVHEVHVDGGPRNVAVALGVQVEHGLVEDLQTVDPHLGGGERVHPADDADALRVGVGLLHGGDDFLVQLDRGDPFDVHGDRLGGVQGLHDFLGVVGDLLQGLGAVEVLAAGNEPDTVLFEINFGHNRHPFRVYGCNVFESGNLSDAGPWGSRAP